MQSNDHCTASLRRYATAGYKKVSGWLTDLAVLEISHLAEIQSRLGIVGPVCEIGVHLGKTFILLHLLTRRDELSAAFDLYELQNEAVGRERKHRLLANLRAHHADIDRVRIVTADSLQLTPARILDACAGAPRLFSIDGGRSAAAIYNDIALAQQTVCDGGLVILTDYFQEVWPEVSEGACRFMHGNRDLHPVVIGGNKFFLAKSQPIAATYRDELARIFGNQARRSIVFGEPVLILKPLTLRRRIARTRAWEAVRHTPVGHLLRALGSRLK